MLFWLILSIDSCSHFKNPYSQHQVNIIPVQECTIWKKITIIYLKYFSSPQIRSLCERKCPPVPTAIFFFFFFLINFIFEEYFWIHRKNESKVQSLPTSLPPHKHSLTNYQYPPPEGHTYN